jgi:hypothetical protein
MDRNGEQTWRVTTEAVKTPALALALLAVALGALEIVARTDAARSRLLAPSVASASRQFETQLDRLDAWVRRHGEPDCVFLGSSLVLTGFRPDVVAAAYATAGGRPIRCFNFGVPGMTAADVGALAQIVAEDYRPRLLIYGTTFFDFSANATGPDIDDLPWVQYRRGTPTVVGWLTDVSRAFRLHLTYRHWDDAEQRRFMQASLPVSDDGHWSIEPERDRLDAPDRGERRVVAEAERLRVAFRHLEGFIRLLELRARGTDVIVVEVPGRRHLMERLEKLDPYQDLLARIRTQAARLRVPFWEPARTTDEALVGGQGYTDLLHFNAIGAERLSRWLGQELARSGAGGDVSPAPATER